MENYGSLGAPEEIPKFADLCYWLNNFSPHYQNDFKLLGVGVHWKLCSFITTDVNGNKMYLNLASIYDENIKSFTKDNNAISDELGKKNLNQFQKIFKLLNQVVQVSPLK